MEANNKLQLLHRISLLNALGTVEMELLSAATTLRRANKFQFIFMQDEHADYLYFLLKGRIKIGAFAEDGREVLKGILQPEALFGDLALAGEAKRSEFAQAMHEEVDFLAIRLSDFRQLMQQNQRLMFNCLQHISQRLQKVEERLASLVLKDARERIIAFLVDTADREGRRVGFEMLVKHHLTQQDIANLTGTSRQTVTSVLNDLRKSNLIHFNRNSILIRDMGKLA
jgi:CRP/FNR family transcriptional regulator, cyclic AMP receptor protein